MNTTPARPQFKQFQGNTDERLAHAAEHIAYSLEGIDVSLKQIAMSTGGANSIKLLTAEVQRLAVAAVNMAAKK